MFLISSPFTHSDLIKLLRKQHPNIDVRFVFSNANNKLTKSGKTTYAQWCIRNDFKYSNRIIDETWLIKECKEDAEED